MSLSYFSIAYFAPIQYYWHWNQSKTVVIDGGEHYQKQSWRNRCQIATANGPLSLSIPILSNGEKSICDVQISDHGNWQSKHLVAIESAYQSSPFFEYYYDDIRELIQQKGIGLFEFNRSIHEKMCAWLNISKPYHIQTTELQLEDASSKINDFRASIHPKINWKETDCAFQSTPYYQVFEAKFGFLENLSILDLLFNMGPESILYLMDRSQS